MRRRKKPKPLVFGMALPCLAGSWISGELMKQHSGPWPSMERNSGGRSVFSQLGGGGEPRSHLTSARIENANAC